MGKGNPDNMQTGPVVLVLTLNIEESNPYTDFNSKLLFSLQLIHSSMTKTKSVTKKSLTGLIVINFNQHPSYSHLVNMLYHSFIAFIGYLNLIVSCSATVNNIFLLDAFRVLVYGKVYDQ